MTDITRAMRREEYFRKYYPIDYNEVIKCEGITFLEKLYNYVHPNTSHICYCGNPTKFINFNKGYAKYCCPGCVSKDPRIKAQKEKLYLGIMV